MVELNKVEMQQGLAPKSEKAPVMQWRLLCKHYVAGQMLEPGTLVGEGTTFPDMVVSTQMEGVTEAAQAKVVELRQSKRRR